MRNDPSGEPGAWELTILVNNHVTGAGKLAEHGLSFHLGHARGWPAGQGPPTSLLFDTGQSGETLLHNAGAVGIDLNVVEGVILSHGHYDHTGGLMALAETRRTVTGAGGSAGGGPASLPLYAHPAAFETKLKLHPRRRDIGAPFSREALEAAGFEMHLSTEPVEVAPDLWTTGEVPRRHRLEEEAVAGFFAERDGAVVADTIPDDLSLIVLHGDGAFSLICGCCHAGLLNTLDHASALVMQLGRDGGGAGPAARNGGAGPATRSGGAGPAPPARVRAVIGGLHTTGASDARLEHTIAGLREYDPAWIAPIHCSGQREAAVLHEALGERVRFLGVGDSVLF